jgi:hypothetical protein
VRRVNVALALSSTVSSALSFGAYALLFWHFGPHSELDELFSASGFPTAVGGIASAVLMAGLPVALTEKSRSEQDCLIGESALRLLVWAALLTAALGVVALIGDRSVISWMAISYFPVSAMFVMSTLTSALYQARGQFLMSLMPSVVTSTGLAVGCAAAVALESVWWVPACHGFAASLLVRWRRSVLPASRRIKCADILLGWWHGRRGGVVRALHVLVATLPFTLFQPMDTLLCARMPAGSLSILVMCQRVLVAFGTVISIGVATSAAFRSRALLVAGGAAAVNRDAFGKTIGVCGLGLVGAAVCSIIGEPALKSLVRVTGKAAVDTSELSHTLGIMLLGCGPMASMPFLIRMSYRLGGYRIPAVVGVVLPMTYLAAGSVISERAGLPGIAWTYVVLWWVVLAVTLLSMRRLSPSPIMSESAT